MAKDKVNRPLYRGGRQTVTPNTKIGNKAIRHFVCLRQKSQIKKSPTSKYSITNLTTYRLITHITDIKMFPFILMTAFEQSFYFVYVW